MNIGTILHHKYFNGVEREEIAHKYQSLVKKHFKHFGMFGTGIMNMIAKGPDPDSDYQWRNTDLLTEFCEQNDLNIHFNTVLTGRLNTFPDWYHELDQSAKINAIERHVRSVIDRYKGRVEFFKLVNEITNEEDPNFLGTGLDKTVLLSRVFKWAVDEYPEGRYMLNEYGPLVSEEKRKKFIDTVEHLSSNNSRIDLIGLQGHFGYNPRQFMLPSDDFIITALEEIHDKTDLPISITEFDLSYQNHTAEPYPGSSIDPDQPFEVDGIEHDNWFQYQGYAYEHLLDICRGKDYVDSVFFWRFNDDPSITWERPSTGLFDKDLEIKENVRIIEN